MKKMIVVALTVVVLLLLIVVSATAETNASIVNGMLVVEEMGVVKMISNVPDGLTVKQAFGLASGRAESFTVGTEEISNRHILGWPMIVETVFLDTVVGYGENGFWKEEVPRTERQSNWPFTIFWLVVPEACILLVSIINLRGGHSNSRLLWFYISMFVGIIVGCITGGIVGTFAGGIAGTFAGVFAGVFAGGIAGVFAGGIAGTFAGGIAGGYAGWFTDWEVLKHYCLFLAGAIVCSFILAHIVVQAKNRFFAKATTT